MLQQPDRSLGGVLVRGFLFFAVAYVAAFAAAWAVAGVWRANASIRDGSSLETAAYAAYVLFVTAVPTAFGFALVTSVWPFFRALSARQVAWLAAGGGIATYLAQATGVVWLL